MDYDKLITALKRLGYDDVHLFDNKEVAADFIAEEVNNVGVGFGDSTTLAAMP